MKSKSFTLIELLVVIVIIGILAGVIVVSTSNNIAKAQDTKLTSAILGLNKALKIYSLDSFPIETIACNIKTSCTNLKSKIDIPSIDQDIYYKTSPSGNFFVIYANKPSNTNLSFEINSDIEDVKEVPSFTNLVAYYPLSIGTSDGTTIADMSPNSNNGTNYGASFGEGLNGDGNTSMIFSGSNYIAIPHDVTFNVSQLTIAIWIKTPATMGCVCYGALLSKQSATRDYNFYIYANDGQTIGRFHTSSAIFSSTAADLPQAYIPETWHHVAITINASGRHSYYSDGGNFYNWDGVSGIANNTFPIWIARADNYYKGRIQHVRIYNRALTETEIKSLYDVKL